MSNVDIISGMGGVSANLIGGPRETCQLVF